WIDWRCIAVNRRWSSLSGRRLVRVRADTSYLRASGELPDLRRHGGHYLFTPAQLVYHPPQPASDWQAVSTHFGGVGLDATNALAEYAAAQSIQETALSSPARVVVFPEAVVSNWNEATDAFWSGTFKLLKLEGK